ncbi:MAG: hypothetical protein Q9169_006242 [Polycauliona sp. 2 TL-2023]
MAARCLMIGRKLPLLNSKPFVSLSNIVQRNASAIAVPTSTAPENIEHNVTKEVSVPNPDPPADSPTAAQLSEHTPYMVATYVRPPPMMVKGDGCYLWDAENRQYLDFTAGIAVNALGHSDPEMAKLLYQQARTLIHTSNLYNNPWTGALSKQIITKTLASGAMHTAAKTFISNSGSEANEAAIKFARKVGKMRSSSSSSSSSSPSSSFGHETKHEILSFHGSFHGRTMGSLSATPNPRYQSPFAPMIPGFKYGTYNDESCLEKLITDKTCGVIIEPIQGEGGVNVASSSFLQALRNRCNEVGAVLIYDEIQCGLGRTGNLWAHQSLPKDAHPDILTTAKALGNGFPIGATIVSEEVAKCIVTGDHGTTFGGNPLACRIAHYIFSRLSDPELLSSVTAKEKVFRKHFEQLQKRFPDHVKDIRGRGLILGLQLASDPTPIVTAARERGLLIITCGTNTLRFVPPLIISEAEIEQGCAILERAMEIVFGKGGEKVEGTKGQQEMAPEGR